MAVDTAVSRAVGVVSPDTVSCSVCSDVQEAGNNPIVSAPHSVPGTGPLSLSGPSSVELPK